jgi:hypothetical protein
VFSTETYSWNILINSKIVLCNILYDICVNFSFTHPILYTVGMCDVTFYESTTLTYRINISCLCCTTIRVALCSDSERCCVYSLTGAHVCATSQSSPLGTDRLHICCRRTACFVYVFQRTHATPPLFSFEGQCCVCFTSKRLSWDENGLGLPLKTPPAVTFSSCKRTIRSRTRTSGKLLWVILPQLE